MTAKQIVSLVLLAASLTSACATTRRGREQAVEFDALPTGTTVRVHPGREERVPTPSTLLLSSSRDYTVYFENPGYRPQSVELKSRLSGAVWRSIDFHNPFIWIPRLLIDIGKGRSRELVPGKVTVTLTPLRRGGVRDAPQTIPVPAR